MNYPEYFDPGCRVKRRNRCRNNADGAIAMGVIVALATMLTSHGEAFLLPRRLSGPQERHIVRFNGVREASRSGNTTKSVHHRLESFPLVEKEKQTKIMEHLETPLIHSPSSKPRLSLRELTMANKTNKKEPSSERTPYRLGMTPFLEPQKETKSLTQNASTIQRETMIPSLNLRNSTSARNTTIRARNVTKGSSSVATRPAPRYSSKASSPKELNRTHSTTEHAIHTIGKKPSDVVTMKDLEAILVVNGYVRQTDLYHMRMHPEETILDGVGEPVTPTTTKEKLPTKTSSGVAFPQTSVLSYNSVKWGTTVSASFLGMLVGLSILPNLWLMGALVGGVYGFETGKGIAEKPPEGPLSTLVVSLGRRLAKYSLKVYDASNAMFFMYKTGQLSYDYYKRYAEMDKRFQIQSKVDAWNARFAEGKLKFDKWEKENEIGRKALAGLRTVWLVEERSLKKRKIPRQSKYRLIQWYYDVTGWFQRLFSSVWKAVTGKGSSELQEFLKGLRIDISESKMNDVGRRIGASTATLSAVFITGALFAISPTMLGMLAILTGVIWPTWPQEFYDRASQYLDATRARGRGEEPSSSTFSRLTNRYDKSRYHYYVRTDGKKKYYRTGQSMFGTKPKDRKQKSSEQKWPWLSNTKPSKP